MLPGTIIYVKRRTVTKSRLQIQNRISSKLVRENVIGNILLVDVSDVLDTSCCSLMILLLRRNHFATCNSAQLLIVVECVLTKSFIVKSGITLDRPLKGIKEAAICSRVSRNLAPKIQSVFFSSVIYHQITQWIMIRNVV